tara:strand:- start:485 stop:772 length:288 start_codon:yes stop_codon:yes gene_type:complete
MKSLKQREQQSRYNRDALIFRILEDHKTELQEMSNKELVNVWKFTQIVKEEPQKNRSLKSLDADLQEIKIIAEDLVIQARKAGHTIIPKLQPETD